MWVGVKKKNKKQKLNKNHCQPLRLAFPTALIHPEFSWKFVFNLEAMNVIQVVRVYSDLSSLSRAHATLRREKGSWWRHRQRDHMEFHSFRFLSQMLFSNWLMLFLLLMTVVNSWCVGRIVWISACCERACVFTYGQFCLFFSYLCPLRFAGRAAWEVCVGADATHSAAMPNWNRLEP